MDDLAHALEQFNRTEPDLLFRDAFGHSGTRLCLSRCFLERIKEATGIGVDIAPRDAWWAAEYPFNCLAGAILLWVDGKSAKDSRPKNAPRLITSGREDVDFVVSFKEHLILIEAKAHTNNDRAQVKRKLERLRLLRNFYLGLERASSKRSIKFHFILASPIRPKRLDDLPWPEWACKGGLPWMPLRVDEPPDGVLRVTRCDKNGDGNRDGPNWRIVPGRSFHTGGACPTSRSRV